MDSRTLGTVVLRSLSVARKLCGLALVFAAFSGTAQAFEPVPEMDAGTMGSALTLFIGGVLLLKSRYRRQ